MLPLFFHTLYRLIPFSSSLPLPHTTLSRSSLSHILKPSSFPYHLTCFSSTCSPKVLHLIPLLFLPLYFTHPLTNSLNFNIVSTCSINLFNPSSKHSQVVVRSFPTLHLTLFYVLSISSKHFIFPKISKVSSFPVSHNLSSSLTPELPFNCP